jgi:hypothetical protein
MSPLMVILTFAVIAAINLPRMIKNKQWHDVIVYSAIFALVFALAMAMALGAKIPSPIKAAQVFYRDILHLSFKPP